MNNKNNMNYIEDLVNAGIGLSRGNMFESIYKPYLKAMPLSGTILTEREKELRNIQVYDFALKDIGLYLDIYPGNKVMLDAYNYHNDELKKMVRNYEKKYGTITLYSDTLKIIHGSG